LLAQGAHHALILSNHRGECQNEIVVER